MTMAQGPLAGMRIVELDAIGPVPLAGMILADLGADVVRLTRSGGGFWDNTGGAILNRNRPFLNLDLKLSQDREKALSLISDADALIEGFRPGVMERLGLAPETCLQRNPRLAYVRMTGWGQTGPLAPRAGHDINYIALTGALHAMGQPGTPPPVPLNLVGDYGGGAMMAVIGLLSAVSNARASGAGQVVDAAMVDGVSLLSSLFHALSAGGLWSSERGSNLLDGGAPFYRCYGCQDGEFVAVGALEPPFFAALVAGLKIDFDLGAQYDQTRWPELTGMLEESFLSAPRDHWARLFEATDACVTPVLSFTEASGHPHSRNRDILCSVSGVVQPSPAPRLSITPTRIDPDRCIEVSFADIHSRWKA